MAEPVEKHDSRCPIWTSVDPAAGCDCRDTSGKTPRHADEPFATRLAAETAWHAMTLCERAEQLDSITAKGA